VHTNHFLLPPAAGVDTMPGSHPGTLDRYVRVARAARESASVPRALGQHGAVVEPVCRHGDPPGTAWADRRATLLAVWAQPALARLRVAAGAPCAADFVAVEGA
jgi:hypothetical protein